MLNGLIYPHILDGSPSETAASKDPAQQGGPPLPDYEYVSKDRAGRVYRSRVEADDLGAFYRFLNQQDQFCISVREAARRPVGSITLGGNRMKLTDLTVFCRQFSTMISSGITVIRCLEILYQQAENKRVKAIIMAVYEAVQRGESLSGAMRAQKDAFPLFFLNMIEAGENSGSLDQVLLRMADSFEKDSKTRNRIVQAMIYPIVLLSLTVLVVIFMLTFVLPKFLGMFQQLGGALPLPTRILLGLSGFLIHYWYILIAVLIVAVILIRMVLRSPSGRLRWDRAKLSLPVIGKRILVIHSAVFSRTFAALISSGMPIIQSLETTGHVLGNAYLAKRLSDVVEEVRSGVSFSQSFRSLGIFPAMLCSMISVGEESGHLDEILRRASALYDEESDAATQRLVALIEPILIVFLAVVVGFIILSIILPIFSIYNQIGSSG